MLSIKAVKKYGVFGSEMSILFEDNILFFDIFGRIQDVRIVVSRFKFKFINNIILNFTSRQI